MKRYDSESPVDAEEWALLKDGERQALVERFHKNV